MFLVCPCTVLNSYKNTAYPELEKDRQGFPSKFYVPDYESLALSFAC